VLSRMLWPRPRHVNAPQSWLSLTYRAKTPIKIKELYIIGSFACKLKKHRSRRYIPL